MTTQTLAQLRLPALHEDETIYSYVAGYHLLFGHLSPRTTLLELFGSTCSNPGAEFPSNIPTVSSITGTPLDDLLEDHTNIKFYRFFLPEERYKSTYYRLSRGDTDSLQTNTSAIANRIPPPKVHRYCPICRNNDRLTFGRSIWHVEHQLPGVLACVRHKVLLLDIPKNRKKLGLPSELPGEPIISAPPPILHASQLCVDTMSYPDFPLSSSQIIETYRNRLQELGLACSSGRIRQAKLRQLIQETWKGLFVYNPYNFIKKQLSEEKYPSCIFYNTRATHHPLKHILLIGCLFDSLSDFTTYLDSNTIDCQPPQENDLNTGDAIACKKVRALELLKNGSSLREAASESLLSISTVKALALQHSISINRRPSKIFETTERAILRKLIIGEKTEKIASLFSVSICAVEQVLKAYPEISKLRKRIRLYKKLNSERRIVTEYRCNNPSAKRDNIRMNISSTFNWLFRNDKKWLYDHLPPAIPRSQRPFGMH